MSRTLAVGLVGAWLGLLVASWIFASLNFRTADRVLGPHMRPEVDQKLAGVAPTDRRTLMRHLVSEVNRAMFRAWGPLQLALGGLALALLWSAGGVPRALTATAVMVLVAQAALLAAPIVELGRAIDFVPRPLPAEVARRFGLLHAAYVGADFVKAALLVAVASFAARRAG
jgi:hypothetical protein